MRSTLLSEWTKLRTQRGALIAIASMCVLMVGMSALSASEQQTNAVFGGDDDVVQIALAGAVFAALAAVVAGVSPDHIRVLDGDDPDDAHRDAGTVSRARGEGRRPRAPSCSPSRSRRRPPRS